MEPSKARPCGQLFGLSEFGILIFIMTISTFNPMLTEKCREGEMVNRMLGEPGDSQSPQKRSVLPFETDWDGARRRRPRRLETKGTIQRDDHGGRLPLSGGLMLCTRTRLHVVRCHSFLSLILQYLLSEVLYFHVTTIPSQNNGCGICPVVDNVAWF